MAMQDLLEIDLSIPPDQLQLGHDADGLPRVEPVEVKDEAEKAAPAITQDDLDSARWQAEQIAKERDKFVRERDEARQAYAGSERELGTRTSQAIRAHMHAVQSEHQQFVSALSAVKQEAETAKRDLAQAFADENMDPALKGQRVADAQERLSLATTDMRTLEQAKIGAQQRLEEAERAIATMAPHKDTQPANRQSEREVIPPEQQTPDQWIKQFPPPTQRWLNEHKDFVTDPKMHRKLLRFADEFTDDNGTDQLHTSGFISALNDKFFPKKETENVANDDTEVDTTPQRRQTAPAAPVSRNSSSSSSRPGMSGKVRLSAIQQDAALKMYSDKTPAEALHKYAQNLKRLEQDGISLDMPKF